MHKIPGYVELCNYLVLMDMEEFERIRQYYADVEIVEEMERRGVQRKPNQAPYLVHAIYASEDRECYPDEVIKRLREIIRKGVKSFRGGQANG